MQSKLYESMNQPEQRVLDAMLFRLYRVKLDDYFICLPRGITEPRAILLLHIEC